MGGAGARSRNPKQRETNEPAPAPSARSYLGHRRAARVDGNLRPHHKQVPWVAQQAVAHKGEGGREAGGEGAGLESDESVEHGRAQAARRGRRREVGR